VLGLRAEVLVLRGAVDRQRLIFSGCQPSRTARVFLACLAGLPVLQGPSTANSSVEDSRYEKRKDSDHLPHFRRPGGM
jgi:hypothetical protein